MLNDRIRSLPASSEWTGPAPEQQLYVPLTPQEDKEHTNVHYEQPPEFFNTITGGEWNVYSCNLWDGATNDTESQEAKLDLFAQLMELQAGQRILDVGCGWAGPLVYLCKTYGAQGVGLTLSPTQKRFADRRIAEHGVDVEVHECHWQDFQDDRGFDAIFTDEVIVHFSDLGGFFAKANALLHPGGRFVNKELHFRNSRYKQISRTGVFVNEIYGLTGNYRTLGEELALLDENGFALDNVHQIPLVHYCQTLDRWLSNMYQHRGRLHELVGEEYYRHFRTYLKIVRRIMNGRTMTLDVVGSSKL